MKIRSLLFSVTVTSVVALAPGCTKKVVESTMPQSPAAQQQQPPAKTPNIDPAQQFSRPTPASGVTTPDPAATTAVPTTTTVAAKTTTPAKDPNVTDANPPPVGVVTGMVSTSGCTAGCGGTTTVAYAPIPAPIAPVDNTPAVLSSMKCQELDNPANFLSLADRWQVKFSPKLDLKDTKGKKQKKLMEQLTADLNSKASPWVLEAIRIGLLNLRAVNPELACSIVESTSTKGLTIEGPSSEGDAAPSGVAFKRHNVGKLILTIGIAGHTSRILVGEKIFEAIAVNAKAQIVDPANTYYPVQNMDWANGAGTVAQSALFEQFLDFGEIKVDAADHKAAEASGGGETDSILACVATTFQCLNIVTPDRLLQACDRCAQIKPSGGSSSYDPNFWSTGGQQYCGNLMACPVN